MKFRNFNHMKFLNTFSKIDQSINKPGVGGIVNMKSMTCKHMSIYVLQLIIAS